MPSRSRRRWRSPPASASSSASSRCKNAGIVVASPGDAGDAWATSKRRRRCWRSRASSPWWRSRRGACPARIIIAVLAVDGDRRRRSASRPSPASFALPPSLAPTFLKLDIVGALDIGLVDHRLRLLLRRSLRQYRHAGRRRLPRRADRPGRPHPAARPRLHRRFRRRPSPARCSAPRPSPAISRAPPACAPAAAPVSSAWSSPRSSC